MHGTKTVRVIFNSIYGIGSAAVFILGTIALFGPNEAVSPMAMIPFTYRELAFLWLAFGTVPMVLACVAVYQCNDIRNSARRKRNFILIFLPGFICSACALYGIGIMIAGYIHSFVLR